VHGEILQHQVERGDRVLQVVHEEGGHRLERFQFLGLHEFTTDAQGQQIGGNLSRNAAQKIQLLVTVRLTIHAIGQNNDAEMAAITA
jgi:hypothetical protein